MLSMTPKTKLTSVADAQQQILSKAVCQQPTEKVALFHARGRVLSTSLRSHVFVPPENNSAMDGYAMRLEDLHLDVIPVSQRIAAGQVAKPIESNTCARIFTGAPTPINAQLIVIQEDVVEVEGGIKVRESALLQGQSEGQFIRAKGQDITKGQVVCEAGTKLEARHLGVLASMGINEVEVYQRLKVAIASTGSELVNPGEQLAAGQIYNSNRFLLAGLVDQLGMEIVDLGIIEDDPILTRQALKSASESADVIITSGGVSEGEEDHVKGAVEALGHLEVWKLAIKPGKPLAFGQVLDTPFFGLPGNPASVLVTFMILARPYLLAQQGATEQHSYSIKARLMNPPQKPSIRQEYLRVSIVSDEQEGLAVEAMTNQNSGVLTTAMKGSGLAVIKPNTSGEEARWVEFLPYASFGV